MAFAVFRFKVDNGLHFDLLVIVCSFKNLHRKFHRGFGETPKQTEKEEEEEKSAQFKQSTVNRDAFGE